MRARDASSRIQIDPVLTFSPVMLLSTSQSLSSVLSAPSSFGMGPVQEMHRASLQQKIKHRVNNVLEHLLTH